MPVISFAPSEAAIQAAIEARIGSPGFLQRVAEQIARGLYVEFAPGLVPYGRLSNDKSIRGWPDAFMTKADGSLIAIEATTAGNAAKKHWPDDLAKFADNLPPTCRGGLVWLAWCKPPRPADVLRMREAARLLGIGPEDIHILFQREACAQLHLPFHANFWINDLGLRVTPGPLSRVTDVIGRVNMRRSSGAFPTREEYENDLVYSPPILADVEGALTERRAAMVIGHGASGKTTLAMLLSHRPRFRFAPSYYLDLTATAADPTLTERAEEAIAAIASRGILFILDNAHLDTPAAARLFSHWEDFGRESNLLILARRVRPKVQVWNSEPELETITVPSFDLVIEPADLEGVYRRHYFARRGGDAAPVGFDVLRRWQRLFGGDLMSFSAAVLGLLDRGGEADALEPADARAYVRDRYLDNASAAEQAALLDLAAVAEVEGYAPVEAFPEGALTKPIRRGIVWVESRGGKETIDYYRLAHAGLGTLLRDSAGISDKSREARGRLLAPHPYACIILAQRLQGIGEQREAADLIAAMWRNATWPPGSLGLHWWASTLTLTQELGVLDRQQLSDRSRAWLCESGTRALLLERALTRFSSLLPFLAYTQAQFPDIAIALREGLAASPGEVAAHALRMPLADLPPFLAYARSHMPHVAQAVREGLAAGSDTVVTHALKTSFTFFPVFLSYARTEMPEVAEAVRKSLLENREGLRNQLFGTSFNHIPTFHTFAQTEMPEVAEAICELLGNDLHQSVQRALASPVHCLQLFLTYAKAEIPAVAAAVREEFEKDPAGLLNRTLAAPLNYLPPFVLYLQREMPEVARILCEGLSDNADRLIERASATSLSVLPSFLSFALTQCPPVARRVHEEWASKPEQLVEQALLTPLSLLRPFLDYARAEAPEAAATIHNGLVRNPDALARLATEADPNALLQFLEHAQADAPDLARALSNYFVLESGTLTARVMEMPLGDLPAFLDYAQIHLPDLARQIRNRVDERAGELARRAVALPIDQLGSFATYARAKLRKVGLAIHRELAANWREVVARVLEAPLNSLPSFLTYLNRVMPTVAKAVQEQLAGDRVGLVRKAAELSFGDLRAFLLFADSQMPGVADAVADGLAKEPDDQVRRALEAPLEQLTAFLEYAQVGAPDLLDVILDGLAQNVEAFTKHARETSSDHLGVLLSYLKTGAPSLYSSLLSGLLSDLPNETMAERRSRYNPEKILSLCRQDEAFTESLKTIDIDLWSEWWGDHYFCTPVWFRGFATLCYKIDRGDLAGLIADAIIRTARAQDLSSPACTLPQLSFILTSPHRRTQEEVERFIARCIPEEWLAGQYGSRDATVGALAGVVRSVAMDDRDWLAPVFSHPALWRRVEAERPTPDHPPLHVAEWLQLLGGARLLNPHLTLPRPASHPRLAAALALIPPGAPDEGIRPMQAGLWFGLREWCRLRQESVVVDASLGDAILAQFRAAAPVNRPRMTAFNAMMIEWLKRCHDRGWSLALD